MKLSETDFAKIARSHSTSEDHRKLAEHYAAHAMEHENDAKLSEELASKTSGHHATENVLHAELHRYAASSKEAAAAMRNLSKIHEDLAKEHDNKKSAAA